MKIDHPLAMKLGGLGIGFLTRRWMSTLDIRGALYDPTTDPAHPGFHGRAIFVFWHEYIMLPFYVRGRCEITMLLSTHRDAQWLAEAARFMGFSTTRGSTYRGGSKALQELVRSKPNLNIAITPDGPRGPRRQLAAGPIYLASRMQVPIIAMGMGYDRPWRMKSWDRFAVPRPFSRARAIMSPRVHLPSELDRDGIEHYRRQVEDLLNELTCEAEDWAAAGDHRVGEYCSGPRPMPIGVRRRRREQLEQLVIEESSSVRSPALPRPRRAA